MTTQSQQWKALSERATALPWKAKAMGGCSTVLSEAKPSRNDTRIPAYGYRDVGEHCIAYPFIEDPAGKAGDVGDVRLDFVCFSHEDAALITFAVNNFTQLLAERDEAVARSGAVSLAERDVLAERRRQVEALGWTPDHDDHHDKDLALPRAAACYALSGTGANGPFWINHLQVPQQVWPYRWEWKPKDRRTNLVRAAALLLAEIERLDRATLSRTQEKGG